MSRVRRLRGLALAVSLLTALPVSVAPPAPDERTDAAAWFVLVGLAGGLALGLAVWIATRFFYGLSGVAAALLLAAGALATRMLHWDGLADVADAWYVTPDRRLDVLADSRVGAFGVLAVVLAVLVLWSALVEMASSQVTAALVVLGPVLGRLAATFSAWLGAPARPGGLGASVMGRPSVTGVVVAGTALAAACAAPVALGAGMLLVAIVAGVGVVLALVVPHLVARHFGGVTGDTMGASVVVVESLVFVTALAAATLLRLAGLSA